MNALEVRDLVTEFRVRGQWWPAVRGVSFALAKNETLALVGESGCGKSVTALSVMGLIAAPQGRIASGHILVEGEDLVGKSEAEMEKVRGDRVAMVFQEPMSSLNPVMTIGAQVAESLRYHRAMDKTAANAAALALLDEVKIPSAKQRFHDYPHQFSGGMRQRVMIAMALACQPTVLLADEPTTALDVTIQAQVLSLLNELRDSHGMAVLFITHNLGVVANIADRVAVMYAGEIVEIGTAEAIFANPTHPYTEALFSAIPRVDRKLDTLHAIAGQVPSIDRMPPGCRFAPRCALRRPSCETAQPTLAAIGGDGAHQARCFVRAPAP